ncbi:MAG: hypothetical protein QOJ89_2004 [bacterium]
MPATVSSNAHHDDVADALRGPSPHEARESLVYWRGRLEDLPRRRRAARREARAMVVAWEGRVRRAEIERWGGGTLGRFAAWVVVLRSERPRALARRAVGAVPRGLVVGVLTVTIGTVLVFGVLLGAILSALL